MNTQVVGVSVDHVPALKAWGDSLDGISFPLLSDFWPHGKVAEDWAVFRAEDGYSERAIFIVDAEGVVRYVDVHDIGDQPDNDVLFAELAKIAGPESRAPQAQQPVPSAEEQEAVQAGSATGGAAAGASALQGVTIRMYCRSSCPDCRRARNWLDEQGIEYEDIDVDTDAEARVFAASLNDGDLHTPTFVIGEGVCVDFKPDRLRELLELP